MEHEGVVGQGLDERSFCDYVSSPSNVFHDKFSQYREFEQQFADYGALSPMMTGAGWELNNEIGVYCLNSALCCSGGLKGMAGNALVDRGRLAIDTRSIHSWKQKCKARYKILMMHHPINWLSGWAQRELTTILHKDFVLCLSGHNHDQSSFHSINKGVSLVECSAPPLFTSKAGDLGYSIISICPDKGVTDIAYRQWTKYQTFVTGVSFSNSDDGKVIIAEPAERTKITNPSHNDDTDFVDRYLSKRLDEALESFTTQPRIWVDPVIANCTEVVKDTESVIKIELATLVSDSESTIIKAPPQFGLTCLAHHLIREAWRHANKSLWLYLDLKNLRADPASIDKSVAAELKLLGCKVQDIQCVVVDSLIGTDKGSLKILHNICSLFNDKRIIVMQTIDSKYSFGQSDDLSFDIKFKVFYLWSLTRSLVRKVVAGYNKTKHIGEEDSVISKVVTDLGVLNLHRTPLNCILLLKASEVYFDESPVNRAEMINRVLFLLFNVDDIPTYKVRPDLKDCEYVLGYFCEKMIRESKYIFTRDSFIKELEECCKKSFIDLEVQVVFDVLTANHILIKRGDLFYFRFTYWIYYFAAHRMHHDKGFADFIFADKRYANYPEIIEFYTGIDRRREDALQVLINDVRDTCDKVKARCGLPSSLNPYRFARWRPSPAILEHMKSEIEEGVMNSKLPEAIKDKYADRLYDRTRPYEVVALFETGV